MPLVVTAAPDPISYAPAAMQQLREAIRRLPPEEREVFLLRQNGELTYEQVAQRNNCSVKAVKEQMQSALRKLRPVVQEAPPGCQSGISDRVGP
jgi:RNA polymerase sigma-70 factor (ECF subfamily)